jgi:release factor glutamine methyltransferase
MRNQSIKEAREFIRDELSLIYPREEIISLTKVILLETSGFTFADILAHPERTINTNTWHKISKICADLKENRPIQHILGKTEFFGLQLRVNEFTLIPRQETEELVDLILRENQDKALSLIDIGTGSGAIAIALCRNLDDALITATDISEDALEIARENGKLNNCDIRFVRDDILNSTLKEEKSFDLMISNPPYIRESEKSTMHKNVLGFEPDSALFVPDKDPLKFYRAIGRAGLELVKPGGAIYFEINEALGKETADLLLDLGYCNTRIIKDLNKKDRIVSAKILL